MIMGWSILISGSHAEVRAVLAQSSPHDHGDNAAALAASTASLAEAKAKILAQLEALPTDAKVHVFAYGPRPDLHPNVAPTLRVHHHG